MMDLSQIATVVGSVIVPIAGVWVLLRRLKNEEEKEKQEKESLKAEMASRAHADTSEAAKQLRAEIWEELRGVKEDNKKLRDENAELRSKYIQLETKYQLLESQMLMKIAMLESTHNDLPIPQWLKDEKGVVLSLNTAYVKIFLEPRGLDSNSYKGKTDYAIWPTEVADQFKSNDEFVMQTDRPWIGYEDVPDKNGNMVKWQILKYPRKAGNLVIGIAGVAFPSSYEQMVSYISGSKSGDNNN